MKWITKQIIYTCVLILCISTGLWSCKKTFVTNPSDSLVPSDLSGASAPQSILNGVYRSLRNPVSDDGSPFQDEMGIFSIHLACDLMGEDLGMSQVSQFRYYYDYSDPINITEGLVRRVWYRFYKMIDNVNQVLETKGVGNAQRGQALALRAYAYYNLINLFTNKSYKQDSTTPVIPLYKKTTQHPSFLASSKQIYEQIVADLTAAVPLLKNYSRPQKSHIDSSVVYGLLARAYLLMGRWKSAEAAAKAALGSSTLDGSDLMDSTVFKEGFNNADNAEWMWGLSTNTNQRNGWASLSSMMDPTITGYAGNGALKFMAKGLYDSMPPSDIRRRVITPIRNSSTMNASNGDLAQVKFRDPNSSWSAAEAFMKTRQRAQVLPSYLAAVVLMRKAEMYLIIAECCARSSGSTAKECLKKLKEKRGNKNTTTCNLDSVLVERRRELWGEGFRLFDLKRTHRAVVRGEPHSTNVAHILYVTANSDSLKFAIPQRELDNNMHYRGTARQ